MKFISVMKNLFITNEGTKCTKCDSLILVKQTYKEALYIPLGLLFLITLIGGLLLGDYLGDTLDGSILDGTLYLVFIKLFTFCLPSAIAVILYGYFIPIVNGTEEEIKKRNKVSGVAFMIQVAFWIIGAIWLYYF